MAEFFAGFDNVEYLIRFRLRMRLPLVRSMDNPWKVVLCGSIPAFVCVQGIKLTQRINNKYQTKYLLPTIISVVL